MDLNLVRLVFTLKLEADCSDPYAFFSLRSCFRDSFRRAAGCMEPACLPCSRKDECPFHRNFSQSLSADPAALRRYQKPSLPFVFDIPILPRVPNSGKTVELGLVLAGTAVNYVAEYTAATVESLSGPSLGKKVSMSLLAVESAGHDGARNTIMTPGTGLVAGDVHILSLKGLQEVLILPPDSLSLSIVTPMQLMVEGKHAREFAFSPFIRALFRRVSSMVHYYGGEEEDLDFAWLADQSRRVESISADFRWVESGSTWRGVVGKGIFVGDLADYHPFLIAGEYLHLGKGASYGLGRFLVGKAA